MVIRKMTTHRMNTWENDLPWKKFDQESDHCNSDKSKGWLPAMIVTLLPGGFRPIGNGSGRQPIRIHQKKPTIQAIISEPMKWIAPGDNLWPSYWWIPSDQTGHLQIQTKPFRQNPKHKAMAIRKKKHPWDPYPNNDLQWKEFSLDTWRSFLVNSDR